MCTHHSSGGHIEATYPATGCQDKKISCYALYVSASLLPAPLRILAQPHFDPSACAQDSCCWLPVLIFYFMPTALFNYTQKTTHTQRLREVERERQRGMLACHTDTDILLSVSLCSVSGNGCPCSHAIYIFCSHCRLARASILCPGPGQCPGSPRPGAVQLSSTARQKACCLISSRGPESFFQLISQLLFLWEAFSQHYRNNPQAKTEIIALQKWVLCAIITD